MAKERIKPLVNPGKDEPVPNYLRASTGSCHDFCKYGRMDAFEEKTKRSIRKRIVKSSTSELIYGEQQKEKLVNHKAPRDIKTLSVNLKHSFDIKSNPLRPKASSISKSYSPGQSASSGDKNILLKYQSPLSVKKPLSADPPEEMLQQSKMVEVSLPNGYLMHKTSRAGDKADHQSEKLLSKSKQIKVTPLSSEIPLNEDQKARKSIDVGVRNRMMVCKVSKKKAMTPAVAGLPLKITRGKKVSARPGKAVTSKLTFPLEEKVQMTDTKTCYSVTVPEKTLHVIRIGAEDDSSASISSDHAIPSFPSPASPKSFFHIKSPSLSSHEKEKEDTDYRASEKDESVTYNDEYEEIVKEETLTENPETLTKRRVTVSEDKYGSPVKLKFNSGKVMDLQSGNNDPSRLKFRKGKDVAAGNGKGDPRMRTIKKSGWSDNAKDAEISSAKVVLKHQDIEGKKNAQGLFNNVIEETASKLVESRKSKVKALVGAFETVISLQEKKPTSHSFS